jgi:hypothetical protein
MTPSQRQNALEALNSAFDEKDNYKSWEMVAIAIGAHLGTIRECLSSNNDCLEEVIHQWLSDNGYNMTDSQISDFANRMFGVYEKLPKPPEEK